MNGDAISRQAVEDITWEEPTYTDALNVLTEIREKIRQLPPVTPQPKTGHWIELGCVGNDNYNFKCSECHHIDTQSKTVKVNYCWYCGAKMQEEEE